MEVEKLVASAINKQKRMWKLINNEMGNTKKLIDNTEMKHGSDLITNPQLISDKFNSFFMDTIAELKSRIKPSNPDYASLNYNFNSIYLSPITEHEVEGVIKMLKNSYLTGYDEFPEIVIKHCDQYIIKPLVYIFNLSFQCGTFPDMLKISKIKPIPKGGNKSDIQNYRPISILSVFSKILEKVMYKRLNSHIEKKNNILIKGQFGFRCGKSVENACHTFLNNIQGALENKLHVIGIFLDLTKAYDVLNHQMLLDKLESYGIRGIANQWFQSHTCQIELSLLKLHTWKRSILK
jgi:hypothetical protein